MKTAYSIACGLIGAVAGAGGGFLIYQNRYAEGGIVLLMAAGAIWVSAANAYPLNPRS